MPLTARQKKAQALGKKAKAKRAKTNKVTKEEVKIMIEKKLDDVIEDKIFDNNFALSIARTSSDPLGHTFMDDNNQFCVSPGAQNVIPQSVTQGGKIGNRIKIKSAKLKFILFPNFFNTDTNPNPEPQMVRCILYYDRLDPNLSTASPFAPILAGSTETFQNGATDAQFQGTMHDMTRSFNDDRFKIMWEANYKIGFAQQFNPTNTPAQNFANNDYSVNKYVTLDYTKHLIKTVKWNDTNLGPSVRGLYFYCYSVACTNVTESGVSPRQQMGVQASIQIKYEDA